MNDLWNHKTVPDNEVVFYDGILYIIYRMSKEGKFKVKLIILDGEFDKPITLADIAKKYPYTQKVIFDDCLTGTVYNYKNHDDSEPWELVGTTLGYA